jgi:hypothetical protein
MLVMGDSIEDETIRLDSTLRSIRFDSAQVTVIIVFALRLLVQRQ